MQFEVRKPDIFFHCETAVFPKGGDNSLCYTTSQERAEWIAKQLSSPAAGPWIKVSERLPEDGAKVLFQAKESIYCGFFCDGTFHWLLSQLSPCDVTHWAEILPPKEEK
jgi:hypothetical protein